MTSVVFNFKQNSCSEAATVLLSFVTGGGRGHQGECLPEEATVAVKPLCHCLLLEYLCHFGINEPLPGNFSKLRSTSNRNTGPGSLTDLRISLFLDLFQSKQTFFKRSEKLQPPTKNSINSVSSSLLHNKHSFQQLPSETVPMRNAILY